MQEAHEVELFGQVRLAKPKFALLSDDGQEIEATFNSIEEKKILQALAGRNQTKVRPHGMATFQPNGKIQRLLSIDEVELVPESPSQLRGADSKPIWEQIEQIIDTAPPEVFANLPIDGASRHDRKLYGKDR
jgi:hypothetical protein